MDKKNKNPNVPNLRFAEYLDTWNNQRIDSNSLIVDGTHQTPNYITEGVKFVSVENIKNPYESNKFISKEDYNSYKIKPRIGDILMTRITAGIIGETYVINKTEDLGYYVSLALIRPDNKYINSNFLSYYINSPYFKHELDKRIIKVAFPRKINLNDIGECKISIPSLIEQEKIATLLNKIDRRIETQSKIIEDYEELKSWITDQIFNREVSTKKLKSLIFEVNQRNKLQLALDVLTVSNKRGFIKQSEQFEERNVASEDTSNYKIVCVDQYAYNPARINVGSIARLNNYEKGIISPMYTCFEINEEKLNPIYFDLFLKSKSFKSQLNKKLEGSVRQCLIFSGMLSMEIPLPSIQTQSVIAKRISMLDSNIKIENTYLVRLKQQKKYLLDNLFI